MRRRNLVAIIEPRSDSFLLKRGPAATHQLVVDAVRYYEGVLVDTTIRDIGPEIPSELAADIGSHVQDAVQQLVAQFPSFAEETDITGFLKGAIQSQRFERGEWKAQIRAWTYSRRPKERDLGVDIGLVVDLLRGDRRVIKALWLQAKKAEQVPKSASEIQDLPDQIAAMRAHTTEAYTMIYTPDHVHVFRGEQFEHPLKVAAVVGDTLLCKRGDRTPEVVALTADSKLVLEILVMGPPGQHAAPRSARH